MAVLQLALSLMPKFLPYSGQFYDIPELSRAQAREAAHSLSQYTACACEGQAQRQSQDAREACALRGPLCARGRPLRAFCRLVRHRTPQCACRASGGRFAAVRVCASDPATFPPLPRMPLRLVNHIPLARVCSSGPTHHARCRATGAAFFFRLL